MWLLIILNNHLFVWYELTWILTFSIIKNKVLHLATIGRKPTPMKGQMDKATTQWAKQNKSCTPQVKKQPGKCCCYSCTIGFTVSCFLGCHLKGSKLWESMDTLQIYMKQALNTSLVYQMKLNLFVFLADPNDLHHEESRLYCNEACRNSTIGNNRHKIGCTSECGSCEDRGWSDIKGKS